MGSRDLVFHRYTKLGCDPEDQYGEGICDWRVTATIHERNGDKKVGSFLFVWGKWKKKTDIAALKKSLAGFAQPVRAKQDSDRRRYGFGGYQAKIEGVGRAVRLSVMDAKGTERYSASFPRKYRCRAKGKRTIWGAEIYWYPKHGIALVNNPRACKRLFVQVVSLKR